MGTELTVLNNPPAALQQSNWDAKAFRIRPAQLDLVQRMSKSTSEGALVGHFYDTKTGTNLKRMQVVLAAIPQDNRVLMPPNSFGSGPICKSRDAVVPVTDDPRLTAMSPTCQTCDHSSWKKWHANGKRREDVPQCREQIDFIFVERETLLPFRLNVHGKSLKPFREKMEGVARLAKVLLAQGKKPEPYWFSMELSTKEESNTKGTWYELVVSNIVKIDDEAIAKFEQAFKEVMSNKLKIQTDADDIEGEIVNGSSESVSAPAEA